jgi:hypothetical protein
MLAISAALAGNALRFDRTDKFRKLSSEDGNLIHAGDWRAAVALFQLSKNSWNARHRARYTFRLRTLLSFSPRRNSENGDDLYEEHFDLEGASGS